MKNNRPVQRALAECRARGWTAAIAERWIPNPKHPAGGVRKDLFGGIDIVAITPEGIAGIQVTTGAGHAKHRAKLAAIPELDEWCKHANLYLWSYSKRPTSRRWKLREEALSLRVYPS